MLSFNKRVKKLSTKGEMVNFRKRFNNFEHISSEVQIINKL
jgi:hypothetical protein